MGQSRPISRREFLGAGLAAAALAACARSPRLEGELLGPSRERGHLLRAGAFPPPPAAPERAGVVIVGGGAAGLSAAWALERAGFHDFVLLELEDRAGGNAAWGENAVSAYPWGAHYLPFPAPHAADLQALLADLGVDPRRDVCHAPEERLFIHGRWQEGLFPRSGASSEDLAQKARFDALMARWRRARGRDGRPAFRIPIEESSRDFIALDRVSMAAWLAENGFTSPRLRWHVEYGMRDDYGGLLEDVSAWAGIHYYAAREEGDADRVLTWPAGNGRLADALARRAGARVKAGLVVHRVVPEGGGVVVDAFDARTGAARRWRARRAILAVPRFVAARLAPGLSAEGFAYAPWLVCNLTLERPPEEGGAPPSWDNVLYDSPGLGYVDATHQSFSLNRRRTVWTYYRPLTGDPDARRREAHAWGWETCRDLCLGDLERAHPGLRRRVSRLDAWIWGHGMILPRVGFLWGPQRAAAARSAGPIHCAHSDLSGLSIFEEAFYRGVKAAEEALSALA